MVKKKSIEINKKFLSQKILKKPSTKIQSRDILKELKKSRGYKIVRDERIEDTEYNQSPYFKEEYRKEKERSVKWLS